MTKKDLNIILVTFSSPKERKNEKLTVNPNLEAMNVRFGKNQVGD